MKQTILSSLTPRRNLSCRLAALSFILAVFNLPAFTYTNFNSTAGLNLVGVAAAVGGALRLTPAADTVNGEAWALAKQPCASGFDTSFQFRISNPGSRPGTPPGSDGILFTLQNIGPTDPNLYDLGSPADGNVTVIFNTFWNWPDSTDFTKWDVSANSVGVLSNGLYLAQTDLTPRGINLKDGAVHNARIAFDGTGLAVWLDGVMVLTNVPVPGMASAVDADGKAWVGFGAGTGWAWENHDILSWSFSGSSLNHPPVAQCADVIVSPGANCQANASINNGSFDPDGDPITVRQVPPGPYPLGTNRVTLIVTDDKGASNSCSALVIVMNNLPAFTYSDFNSTNGLNLVGASAVVGGALRLNPAAEGVGGTAWALAKQSCSGGFDTQFQFRIGNVGSRPGTPPGGDGFLFTLQKIGPTDPNAHPNTAPADGSVSVFFNTFWNWPDSTDFTKWDVSGNSVGVVSNGLYLAQTDLNRRAINLKDGAVHNARIAFDGTGVTVWLDGAMMLTNVPVPGMASAVDADGKAWVGFGAFTGWGWESHDILNWSFSSSESPCCVPSPSGLVSWWRAEGSASDSANGNQGTLLNGASVVPGMVGQAFSFDGSNQCVEIPYSPSLVTSNYSIEAWVKPLAQVSDFINQDLIFGQSYGHCQLVARTGTTGVRVVSQFGTSHYTFYEVAGTNEIPIGQFSHLVGTWDGITLRLYINGVLNAQSTPGASPVDSGCPFFIGGFYSPTPDTCGYVGQFFNGLIDEVSYFNRALSGAEVQSVYNAGGAGKCLVGVAPWIITQPAGQTVLAGATATFTATAAGTPPLGYQWRLNGTNLAGATGASLTLSNVQPAQAGNYALRVTNAYGSVTSSNALLTVNQAPPCVTPPAGLVSWWRGEGNALDQVGGNNGVLLNGAGFDAGVVGQAFSFNGSSNSYVEVADSPALRLTNTLTIECWAKRLNTSQVHILMEKGGDWTGGQSNFELALNDTYSGGKHFGFSFAGGWRGCAVTPDAAWHHYAAIAVNGQADPILYIDGVPQTITYRGGLATMNLSASTSPLHIGAQVDTRTGWLYYSSTMIDEPAVFNRALSAAEIQAIYNAGIAGKCPVGVGPSIIAQPASQTVLAGATAMFTATAAGTPPLSYQWRLNGTNLAGATGTSLTLSNVQPPQAGNYALRVTNAFGTILSSNATLTVVQGPPNSLININFAAHQSPGMTGIKVGLAATGQTTNDYWNFYSRDDGHGNRLVDGALPNLKFADGSVSAAGLLVSNAPGCWADGSSDAMYNTYLYPFDGGNSTVTVTNLTAGQYDFYVYGPDGNYQLAVGGTGYGTKTSNESPVINPPVWQEGRQYVLYRGVLVGVGQDVTFTVRPGVSHYAVISGMQIGPATVVAGTPPVIVTQPQSQTVSIGSTVTFTVIASGTAPLSYQWRLGGTNLAGASGSALVLANVQPASAGSYSVRVTNAFGSALSSNAVLTVNRLPVGRGADGKMIVQFPGKDASRMYMIQASTNLLDWVTMGSVTADAEGNVSFEDPDSDKHPTRFYRAVPQ